MNNADLLILSSSEKIDHYKSECKFVLYLNDSRGNMPCGGNNGLGASQDLVVLPLLSSVYWAMLIP